MLLMTELCTNSGKLLCSNPWNIPLNEFAQIVSSDQLVIDVREPDEVKDVRVNAKNFINISVKQFGKKQKFYRLPAFFRGISTKRHARFPDKFIHTALCQRFLARNVNLF